MNITPQFRVKQLASYMFPDTDVTVQGHRPLMRGGKKPKYQATVAVDGKVVARAEDRSWRQCYKTLEIILSKSSFR